MSLSQLVLVTLTALVTSTASADYGGHVVNRDTGERLRSECAAPSETSCEEIQILDSAGTVIASVRPLNAEQAAELAPTKKKFRAFPLTRKAWGPNGPSKQVLVVAGAVGGAGILLSVPLMAIPSVAAIGTFVVLPTVADVVSLPVRAAISLFKRGDQRNVHPVVPEGLTTLLDPKADDLVVGDQAYDAFIHNVSQPRSKRRNPEKAPLTEENP